MTLVLGVLAYLTTAVALVAIAVRGREMYRRIKSGQPDPTRGANKSLRFKNMAIEILGHGKMLKFTGSAIAHWFVMVGFVALAGTLLQAMVQVVKPSFVIPIIGNWSPYIWFTQFIAWSTGVGIVTLIGIRQATRIWHKGRTSRFLGSGTWKAYYVEATILAIVFCVVDLHRLERDVAGNARAIQVVATIKVLVSMAWFIVIATNLTMGVAWHRFLSLIHISEPTRPY